MLFSTQSSLRQAPVFSLFIPSISLCSWHSPYWLQSLKKCPSLPCVSLTVLPIQDMTVKQNRSLPLLCWYSNGRHGSKQKIIITNLIRSIKEVTEQRNRGWWEVSRIKDAFRSENQKTIWPEKAMSKGRSTTWKGASAGRKQLKSIQHRGNSYCKCPKVKKHEKESRRTKIMMKDQIGMWWWRYTGRFEMDLEILRHGFLCSWFFCSIISITSYPLGSLHILFSIALVIFFSLQEKWKIPNLFQRMLTWRGKTCTSFTL